VANAVTLFAEQVKHIIHGSTFASVFGVGENSMWNFSKIVGFEFFIHFKLK